MKKLLFSLVFCAMCSRNEAINHWPMIMSGTPNTLRIPETGTEIPNDAYAERKDIHYIDFQHNGVLVVIGDYAFRACGLREVCIPASVKQLCRGCFDRCASLKRVTFMPGSNLELIGHYAFAESALESIEIPSSVIELGDNCFCECRSLRYVRFMPGGNWWRIVLSALVAIGDDPIEVADDVSRYLASWIVDEDDNDDYVFNIKKVGKHAFASTAIASIAIPASVEEIGDHCFRRCGSLREVRFAEGCHVKKIGESAFAESGLESIEIPQLVDGLSVGCFCGCAFLSRVTFADGSHVRMIGAYAFAKSGLVSIEIPSSVDELGDYCFADCEHLQDIYIGHDLMLPAIGKHIFAGSSVQRIHVRSKLVRDFFERCLANAEFGDLATAPEIILE